MPKRLKTLGFPFPSLGNPSIQVRDRSQKTFIHLSCFRQKKMHIKHVLSVVLLLLFNAVSLLCSAFFQKNKSFLFKMLGLKHEILTSKGHNGCGFNEALK